MKLRKLFYTTLSTPEILDFRKTAMIYSFSWIFDGKNLYLVVSYNPVTIAKVSQIDHELKVEAYSEQKTITKSELSEKIEITLGLNEKIEEFYEKIREDPLLRYVPTALRGARLRSVDLWTGIVTAICQQNASFKQGWTMLYNLYRKTGRTFRVENHDVLILPTPNQVLEIKPDTLKECKLGYRSQTLVEVAKVLESGDLEEDPLYQDPYSAEKILKKIKGIGQYSARLTLVLSLREYALPPIDRWTTRLVQEAYGLESRSFKTVEKAIKTRWGKWAGLGVFFLTVVLDAVPLSKALLRLRKGELKPRADAKELTPLTLWKKL
ncbi:MAG TPA: hypothetical protein ENF55_06290 [Thermoprotei archaeon]|nr:hypothetical protein [Thermoprotei archaeon]